MKLSHFSMFYFLEVILIVTLSSCSKNIYSDRCPGKWAIEKSLVKRKTNICSWQDPKILVALPNPSISCIEVHYRDHNQLVTIYKFDQCTDGRSNYISFDPGRRNTTLSLNLNEKGISQAKCQLDPLYVKPNIRGEIFCAEEICCLVITDFENSNKNMSLVLSYGRHILVNMSIDTNSKPRNITFPSNNLNLNETKVLELNLILKNIYLTHNETTSRIIVFNYTHTINEMPKTDGINQPMISYVTITVTLVLLIAISALIVYNIYRKRNNIPQLQNENASANIYEEIQYVEKSQLPSACIDNELYK